MALDWFDYVEPGYKFTKHHGLTELYSKLNTSKASSVLLLGSCSGFFEFSLAQFAAPNVSIDTVCSKIARLVWLKEKVKDRPAFRVFSFEEELAQPKQYDLIIWHDFISETPGFGYFSKLLAAQLKPGGVFAFISAKPFPNLSTRMSFSPVLMYQQFDLEGPDFPLRRILPTDLAARVDQELAQPRLAFTQPTTIQIFKALNDNLENPALFRDINNFYNNKTGFASEAIGYVALEFITTMQYLYVVNSEAIWGNLPLSASAKTDIRTLNWIVITALLSINSEKGRAKDVFVDFYGQPFIQGTFEKLGLRYVSAIGDYDDVEVVTFTR